MNDSNMLYLMLLGGVSMGLLVYREIFYRWGEGDPDNKLTLKKLLRGLRGK